MDACCTVKHACRNIYVNESRNYESPNERAKYVPLSSPPDKHKVRWDTLTQFHWMQDPSDLWSYIDFVAL